MPPRWHPAPTPTGPHEPTPDTRPGLTLSYFNIKTSQHSLWCGGCSSCPDSQTSSPVVRLALRRGPLSMQRDVRITAGWNDEGGNDDDEGRSWSLGGHKRKESNYLSTPDRVLAASRSPPMHQTFPSQTESDKRGGRDHSWASSP